jgi:hypothetical protein
VPAGNFDDELNVTQKGWVKAGGPLDASLTAVTELCVWVTQRVGDDDAIANAMGMPDMPGMTTGLKVRHLGTPDARWDFTLKNRFTEVDFHAGSASASAIAVFVDADGRQKSFYWSEPVRLSGSGAQ